MRRKLMLALAAGLFFYALSDILLWQRIFEQHDLFEYQRQYDSGHITTLVALIGVGVILLWDLGVWALWWAAAFYTLTFSGLEDVLYYWLDGRAIPSNCPWLNSDPFILFKPAGGPGLAVSAAVWLIFWTATLWMAPIAKRLRGVARLHDRDVVDQGGGDHSGESSASPDLPV